MLAVLKAGDAYLPLDPDSPPARLGGIVSGARPAVVIARQAAVSLFPACPARIAAVEQLGRDLPGYPDDNPDVSVEADNLAYVIYASGSTGAPKGVAVTHRAA